MFATRLLRSRPAAAASACAAAAYTVHSRHAEALSSPPSVHLEYFGIDGVAETIRHVAALGHIQMTESAWAVDFKKIDFKDPSRSLPIASPGFAAAKESGKLALNMDRAPVVLVDGKHTIGSSKTIERYLARRLGLMGSNELEAAHIDAVTEHVRDIKDKYQKAKADPADKAKYFAEVMPEFMQKLEKAVGLLGGSGPALVGSSLSLADATLLVFIKDFFDDKESAKASIAKCPRLQASLEATEKHAGVAKYRASKKK